MNSVSSAQFIEPARKLEVLDHAQVVVVGAGPGGMGAALAAARRGADTIIVERFGSLGGTWTSGILSAIMTNNTVGGIFAEFQNRLAKRGGMRPKFPKEPNSEFCYDSEVAKVVLDEMAAEAGIRVYYFAQVAHVFKSEDGRRVTGVVIQSKEGRHVVTGDVFIDASGDGDVCAMAGVPFEIGREGDHALQPMSMILKLDGVDTERAYAYIDTDGNCRKAWQLAKSRGEVSVPREDVLLNAMPKPGQWQLNCTRILGCDGTKLRDVSAAMTEGRRQAGEIAAFMRKYIPGFENATLAETAPHVGVRETRRILCDYTMTTEDIIQARKHADSIACGDWFIDIHNPKGEGTSTNCKELTTNGAYCPPAGDWYEIPYRSTVAHGMDNLLVAARCLGSTHEAHAAIRASNQICAIGEGVGAAAAQVVTRGLPDVRSVDIKQVQESLQKSGAILRDENGKLHKG